MPVSSTKLCCPGNWLPSAIVKPSSDWTAPGARTTMEFLLGYGRKAAAPRAGPAAALEAIMQQEFEIDAVGSEFMPSLTQYDRDLDADEAPRARRDFTPLEVPVGRRGGPKKRSSSLPPSMVRKQAKARIDDWAAYDDTGPSEQMASLTVVNPLPPVKKRRSLLQKARDVGRAHMLPRLTRSESLDVVNGCLTARTPSSDVAQALRDRGRIGSSSTVKITVAFLDTSAIVVTARHDDACRSVLSAAALAIGVGAEYVSSLGLYAYDSDNRCAARHEPDATASSLKNGKVVLAVRLITTLQLEAAARGFRTSAASANEFALARLLHAQAAAYALDERCAAPFSDLVAQDLAALRLWARARRDAATRGLDADDDTLVRPLALTLLATHGVQAFGTGDEGRVREALDSFLRQKALKRDQARVAARTPKKAAKIELEIVEPAAAGERVVSDDGDAPEAAFLATVAAHSRFGAQLFPCAVRRRAPNERIADQACPPRVLAVSKDGAAILSHDLASELQRVPFAKLRRWTRAKAVVSFEAEQPFDCWGPQHARRRSAASDDAKKRRLRRLAALSRGRTSPQQAPTSYFTFFGSAPKPVEAPASLSEDESSDDDLDAPSRRVRFEIDLRGDEGAAREVLRLLDDYAAHDLQADKPRCQYHSIFGPGLPSAHAERVAKATVGTPAALATEGGGALGDRPTVYNALVSAVIRPPRFLYDCRILGPSSFEFNGKRVVRHDLVLRNARGLRLHCSHWRFTDETKRPCVVFMHVAHQCRQVAGSIGSDRFPAQANSASRVQACSYLPVALSLGCSLFALDCGGSGVSDGAHVSLGWHEADDLRIVLLHLRRQVNVSALIVWGHSMGAAAVIYYQGRYLTRKNVTAPRLDACVLDSPYAEFGELARHLVAQNSRAATGGLGKYVAGFTVTRMALDLVLDAIDATCRQLAGLSPLKDLSPMRHASECSAPALFMQARSDRIIALKHVEALANRYGGSRKLAIVDGTHSSLRNGAARQFVARYLAKHVKLPADAAVADGAARNRALELAPWHRARSALPPA